ncbi:MAG: tripartite tricarboxylate transporter substrate binding protein [Nocardioidaceae bacterium]
MSNPRQALVRKLGAPLLVGLLVGVAAAGCGESGGGSAGPKDAGGWTPTKPVTMIAAFGAGGGTDKVARAMLAGIEKCGDVKGHVEYHEGASGVVGYTFFKNQAGDPSQVMASTTELTTLPMFVETEFTWKDFTPIAQIAEDQVSLAVAGDSPFGSLDDLVAEAKKRSVTVGVVGISGPDNIVKVLLEKQAGFTFETVVFDNGGDTAAAILGGQVDAILGGAGDIVGQMESGDAKILAVFGEERYESGAMAEVPTAAEQGFDVVFGQWRGLLGPPEMSAEESAFYGDCLEKWTKTPEYEKYLETSLALPAFKKSDDFGKYLEDQEVLIRKTLGK